MKKMWSYIAGGLKIKGHLTQKIVLWDQIKRCYTCIIKGGLQIEGYCIIIGINILTLTLIFHDLH